MTIEENVATKQLAGELIDMGFSLVKESDLSAIAVRRFWELIAQMANGIIRKEDPPAPVAPAPKMTDAESRKFEQTTITFGKYSGDRIGDVPMDYLLWIDEDQFRHDLSRYLAADRIQQEQE